MPPTIFVSCGQSSEAEVRLGAQISDLINRHFGHGVAYFAEYQPSLNAVSANIFARLAKCDGFIAVMHHRGRVTAPDGTNWDRASVWIEQEIAIASFLTHTADRLIPIAAYAQRGIKLEGLREKILFNPHVFDDDREVYSDLEARILDGRFMLATSEVPIPSVLDDEVSDLADYL